MAQSEAELKAQGALEAAQDSNNKAVVEAAEHKAMTEAKKAGAPAFEFNPDASPEEKKAQIKAVRAFVKSSQLRAKLMQA